LAILSDVKIPSIGSASITMNIHYVSYIEKKPREPKDKLLNNCTRVTKIKERVTQFALYIQTVKNR